MARNKISGVRLTAEEKAQFASVAAGFGLTIRPVRRSGLACGDGLNFLSAGSIFVGGLIGMKIVRLQM